MAKLWDIITSAMAPIGVFKNIGKLKNLFGNASTAFENFSNNLPTYAESYLDSVTGAHLTGQQIEANEMQMQNLSDQYGKNVEGMQAAGLNPALMYKSGATSAPTVQGGAGTGSFSDLIQLMLLPLNKKVLNAQVQNIKADTRHKEASAAGQEITNLNLDAQMKSAIESTLASAEHTRIEALYRSLLVQYGLPEAEVGRVLKDIQIGDSTISKNEAESELARANAAYTDVKKKIDIDKLPYELSKMSSEARESVARSIVEEYRGYYMNTYGVDVPSGAIASLVGLLTNSFSNPANTPSESGFNELSTRTLFPFIDLILRAFGK